MKYLFFATLLLLSPNTNGEANNIYNTQYLNTNSMKEIQDKVTTLFIATDHRDWETVEKCFANKVLIDYSSMTGNKASKANPQDIISNWKSILPGFDHTHHQLGNFIIHDKTNSASVFCYGTASHYLENDSENLWTVVGSYDIKLQKVNNDWKIVTLKFNYKYQSGNLNLPQLAMQKLNSKQSNFDLGVQNKEKVRNFFKAIEREASEKIADFFDENGVHINPYHSDIFPKGAEGKEAIKNYWSPVFPNFEGMEFSIQEIYAMENPNIIYVKYHGNIKLKNDQGYYKNDYYSTFKFDQNGKIIEYVELFNPITAAKAFNLLDNIK